MACRVVLIGGGSYGWTPTLAGDLFLRPVLDGSTLALVDTDPVAAEEMRRYCLLVARSVGCCWNVIVQPLSEALNGADFVCVSITTGGFEAMANDYGIPEQYGVYHTVGDTVGPGGISRTLRNVPVFVDIAHQMERLCPGRPMIHVTNPLSQLTRAVALETDVPCVGLCHNYAGTVSMLAGYFGVEERDIHAVSVGVNHFTWMKDLTVKGKPADHELTLDRYLKMLEEGRGERKSNTTDDAIQQALAHGNPEYYFNFVLHERFGSFPVGSSNHVAENLPFYCNRPDMLEQYHIRRKGVLPRRQELRDRAVHRVRAVLTGEQPLPQPNASNEAFATIVESLHTGKPGRAIVAMPNRGQVSNLPAGVVVETWAEINGSGIHPLMSGPIPQGLTGMMQAIVDEEEMAVRAAITGDEGLVARALALSPMLHDKESAGELARALLQANRRWLPQFSL